MKELTSSQLFNDLIKDDLCFYSILFVFGFLFCFVGIMLAKEYKNDKKEGKLETNGVILWIVFAVFGFILSGVGVVGGYRVLNREDSTWYVTTDEIVEIKMMKNPIVGGKTLVRVSYNDDWVVFNEEYNTISVGDSVYILVDNLRDSVVKAYPSNLYVHDYDSNYIRIANCNRVDLLKLRRADKCVIKTLK